MEIINGSAINNIPWADKPEGCKDVLWRSNLNPIIPRDILPDSNSALNSAVVPYNNGFAGVFRIDNKCRDMRLHVGMSSDGVNWKINETPIALIRSDGSKNTIIGYDPRICQIGNRYYILYCNCIDGPTVGLAYTDDFNDFYEIGNAFLPFNRNGVLFPRKINGKFAMLSRPSDNGHTPFGDIYYSDSPDLEYWGHHKHCMSPVGGWQALKIGAGPMPIETSEGWLMIYHGVLLSCNGYVYSAGAALLDLEQPWIVKARTKPYILAPQMNYETTGDVPNVVFPCSVLCDAPTGRLTVYYGAADTTVCMAHGNIYELVDYVKNNSLIK